MFKKNIAGQCIYAHTNAGAGQTVTVRRSIDGGTQAAATGSVVDDGNGQYHLVASAADLNGNSIGFLFIALGSVFEHVTVQTVGIIWDEPTANHTTTGSTGKALSDAGGGIIPNTVAAAVWNYLTSAITTAGSIGKFLKDQLDVAVSTRLSEADYTGAANGDIALIKLKTDNLPGAPAAVSDVPTADQVADALLDRTAGVETGWTPRQALRLLLAVLGGKVSGAATTTITFRNPGDTKDRVVAAVDGSGNRTSITYDQS